MGHTTTKTTTTTTTRSPSSMVTILCHWTVAFLTFQNEWDASLAFSLTSPHNANRKVVPSSSLAAVPQLKGVMAMGCAGSSLVPSLPHSHSHSPYTHSPLRGSSGRANINIRRTKSTRQWYQTVMDDIDMDDDDDDDDDDRVVGTSEFLRKEASLALRRSVWVSWWCQVILTTISSVTLIFARTVLFSSSNPSGAGGVAQGLSSASGNGGIFFSAMGLLLSYLSIVWTWGEARLSRRLVRLRDPGTVTRRALTVGASINMAGIAVALLGALQIVGVLTAKALLGSQAVLVGGPTAAATSQTLQPLDILVVQANTNGILSHYLSLAATLWWGRRWIPPLSALSSSSQSSTLSPPVTPRQGTAAGRNIRRKGRRRS